MAIEAKTMLSVSCDSDECCNTANVWIKGNDAQSLFSGLLAAGWSFEHDNQWKPSPLFCPQCTKKIEQ